MYSKQCHGCLSNKRAPHCRTCANGFRACAKEHGVTRCFECEAFPCTRLHDFLDSHWENGISHHATVIDDLRRMQTVGAIHGWKSRQTKRGAHIAADLFRGMNPTAGVRHENDHAQQVRTGKTRRFGFITSRTIGQPRNRGVLETHMQTAPPISIVWAIADHPWHDPVSQAQVRIAMAVGCVGNENGVLVNVNKEGTLTKTAAGKINPNLTIGVNVSTAKPLKANEGLASLGVIVNGNGFIISREQAAKLGLGTIPGLERHIRPYMNGRDLAGISRGKLLIDLFGLNEYEVKERFPAVYEHLMQFVWPVRSKNRNAELRERWWLFQRSRPELRESLQNISRYIATPGTARRRYFVFLDTNIIPDAKLLVVASDDAYLLGVLSSRLHQAWALALDGRLGAGGDPVYVKSSCFDTFPFPDATEAQKEHIRAIAEQLDTHRKTKQASFPKLTLTAMYGVLEKSRAGEPLSAKERKIAEQAELQELQRLHGELDAAVADAYGWEVGLEEDEVWQRLLELNG